MLAGALFRDAGGWRAAVAWIAGLSVVAVFQTWTVASDASRFGRNLDLAGAAVLEGSSHLALLALVPFVYWMLRAVPPLPPGPRLGWHLLATVPFSLVHVGLMVGIREIAFALLGRRYDFGFSPETLFYEYRKDALTYGLLVLVALALRKAFGPPGRAPAVATGPAFAPLPSRPERIAVRKRDREVLIAVADIARIDAAGNYAVLHVGGDTYEIRSSLAKLEADLDPARFVRVHKSHIVNVAHVREVEPWVNGDFRIRLEGGGEVNLSRRYRDRFEQAVPSKR